MLNIYVCSYARLIARAVANINRITPTENQIQEPKQENPHLSRKQDSSSPLLVHVLCIQYTIYTMHESRLTESSVLLHFYSPSLFVSFSLLVGARQGKEKGEGERIRVHGCRGE